MDMKMVVPNGMVKMIIPFRNEFTGRRENYSRLSKTNRMTLVGVNDIPFVVDAEHDGPAGTIGIEFSSHGAYRFFRMNQSELKNQMFDGCEILGNAVNEIEAQMAETKIAEQKIKILESYLLGLFHQTRPDNIFEFCIKAIKKTFGNISIQELERKTGYSSRWLNMKFGERIGVSPKNLCSISRFQFVYQALVNNPGEILDDKSYYHIYYDQSHFIKEFKRFTGMPPLKFDRTENNFVKISYLK